MSANPALINQPPANSQFGKPVLEEVVEPDFVMPAGEPLTAKGDLRLDETARGKMALMPDGTLLISKTHAFEASVGSFKARLERMRHPFKVKLVPLSVITEAYAGAVATKINASQMQGAAKTLFELATKLRASDIHIRYKEKLGTVILFRIHNDLEPIQEHSFDYGKQLVTTIYQAMAGEADATFMQMNPQDARISDRAKIPVEVDGIRVATSPQVDGGLMVLRLLYNDAIETVDPEVLGYDTSQSDDLRHMLRTPTGVNLVAGPTGSGKSTTLQRLLALYIRNTGGRKNVITVEDPPEYPIIGAIQTPVTNANTDEERTEAFTRAIRAAMRLDPDLIMVGEVRDGPSAQLAIRAAMTGHQLWTTVHANSSVAIIDRLIDLGVPLEMATDPTIISGLACQRLVKLLCSECKVPLTDKMSEYEPEDLDRIGRAVSLESTFVKGPGCACCNNKGVVGRSVVAETIVTNEAVMGYLRKRDRVGAIEYWRTNMGGRTMLEHAIDKINAGLIDPFETEEQVGPLSKAPN